VKRPATIGNTMPPMPQGNAPPSDMPAADASLRLLVITSAHLFPSGPRPTAGLFFANLVRRLARLAERLVVVVPTAYVPGPLTRLARFRPQRRPAARETWHGIEVHRPPYFSIRSQRRGWFQARTFCLAAARLCETLHRRHGFTVVLGNGFGSSVHTAQYVGRRLGRPSVGWAVGTDVHTQPFTSPDNLRLFRHNVRQTDLVLTTSDALRRVVAEACGGAPHAHTFYRGIDVGDLPAEGADRAALRRDLGMDSGAPYVLMAGHVGTAKGSDAFYGAFRRLAGRVPTLRAVWVGGGPEAGPMEARAARDGLAGRLTITGRVPRPQVLRFMRAADVMLFTSRAEGLPNVVMEAMAAGLPVVSTRVGGVPEILRDGETGRLVPPDAAEAMASAVADVLADPSAASAMAQRAEGFIRAHFNVDRNAPVLAQVLARLAGGGDPTAPIPACAGVPPGRLPITPQDGP